jgi:hypothetical protein
MFPGTPTLLLERVLEHRVEHHRALARPIHLPPA